MGVLTALTTQSAVVDDELAGPLPITAQDGAKAAAAEIFATTIDFGESSGIAAYDRAAGNMKPGEYTVIAAPTGQGKTAWGLTVAGNVAIRGGGVLYCATADMNAKGLMLRLVCAWAGVSARRAHDHMLGDDEQARVISAMGRFRGLPMVIDEMHGKSVQQIDAQVKRVKGNYERQGKRLRLVVVDYVQETAYDAPPRDWSEERTLRNVSKKLKETAMRHRCHVLGLAQSHPPTPSTKRGEKVVRPSVDNIQNCKAIAKPAEIVGLIQRHKDERGMYPARGAASIVLAKARWRAGTDVPVIFNGPLTRFEDDLDAPTEVDQ